MCLTMVSLLLPGFLLLLLFCLCHRPVGAKRQEPVASPENDSTRLREGNLSIKSSLYNAGSSPHPIREGPKQQLLYCRVGIGYHLQILPNGSVGGVHKPTEYSWLKMFAMKHGVVGIKGVKSGLYLSMSGQGLAHGVEQFSDNCLLKENLEENHYTTYSSLSHPGIYLALSHKGDLRKGSSVGRHQSCTHFLPRRTP
uniref:Fibroblast growth factor n=1 Tax=Seriola lalandi dorsalis TaxID=1841481 RepID=A0A3B4WJA6_SERLL